MRSNILKAGNGLAWLMQFTGFTAIVLSLIGAVLFAIDADLLQRIYLESGELTWITRDSGQVSGRSLSELQPAFFYGLVLQVMISSVFTILIASRLISIMRSINDLNAFRRENIKSFKSLGHYFLILWIIQLPGLEAAEAAVALVFQLSPGLLGASFFCYILSEVFREGNLMMEENKYTV